MSGEIEKYPLSIEEKIDLIIRRDPNTFSIEFNPQWSLYASVQDEIDRGHCDGDFIDDEDRQVCIDTDTMWTVDWYPQTPVGSHCVRASTLIKAIDAMLEISKQERNNDL